ncbi:hypothetical protein DFJ77DRAFT_466520 [Powellomyces hirtus]|nr:hypothetical protein DFJ77DRAFT_466520 [Powellomyces hirtus]
MVTPQRLHISRGMSGGPLVVQIFTKTIFFTYPTCNLLRIAHEHWILGFGLSLFMPVPWALGQLIACCGVILVKVLIFPRRAWAIATNNVSLLSVPEKPTDCG